MLRTILTGIPVSLALSGAALAHDLWLEPNTFRPAAGQPVSLTVQIGHGSGRENWGIRSDRLILLRNVTPGGKTIDLMPNVRRRTRAPTMPLRLSQRGTHLVAMQSSPAQSVLSATRFNDYLKEEGLTPALRQRAATGATDKPGRESYSRRAKTLIQVGPVDPASSVAVLRPLGLDLEIVPERHPYLLRAGERLPVRVYYFGKPLSGALVKLTNLDADTLPIATGRTNGSGRTGFNIPNKGRWLLNVVWTRPIVGKESAFSTIFSSLTFGGRP